MGNYFESYYFVEISIKSAENIRKAEQIKVLITPKHLLVKIETEDQSPSKLYRLIAISSTKSTRLKNLSLRDMLKIRAF